MTTDKIIQKSFKSETRNEKDFPESFFCRHMQDGITGRNPHVPGDGKLFVSNEAIKKMAPSLKNKPVYVDHQDVKLETLKKDADGYITRSFYNELDGWLWAEMIIISDEAKQKIREGFGVSNAYIPIETKGKGTCNAVDFDEEIVSGEFTHMAIVPNPRYEEAIIYTPQGFEDYQKKKSKNLIKFPSLETQKIRRESPCLNFGTA